MSLGQLLNAILVYNASSHLAKIDVLALNQASLARRRIGLVKSDHPMQDELRQVLAALEAVVVDVEFDERGIDNLQIINHDLFTDFKNFTTRYHYPIQNLADLVSFNQKIYNKMLAMVND